ncbi:hypothetical protein FQR65_LT17593 [Abscondita terminalis]|nr:hypothetical protein FQR65_LT17593 [Abscondita terminalis]
MKIQIISDLHQEFGMSELSFDKADIVVFAGDINLGIKGIQWIQSTIKSKPVIYVLGNHEYYKGSALYCCKREENDRVPEFSISNHRVPTLYMSARETYCGKLTGSAKCISRDRYRNDHPLAKPMLSAAINNRAKLWLKGREPPQSRTGRPDVGDTPYKVAVDEEGVGKVDFSFAFRENNDADVNTILP